jgi:ankyrin repeat protein
MIILDKCEPISRDERDRNGCTALHLAAEQGALPIVQLLISRGWSVKVMVEIISI